MNQNKFDILKHFLKFCKKELNIQSLPTIKLTADKEWVAQARSFGEYNPHTNAVKVYYLNRNMADVCRSLAHELCHHRQNELGLIYNDAGETGTDIENDANAMAGILMRDYGKLNLGVYDLDSIGSLSESKQFNLTEKIVKVPQEELNKSKKAYDYINANLKKFKQKKQITIENPYLDPKLKNFFQLKDLKGNDRTISIGLYNNPDDLGDARMDPARDVLLINLPHLTNYESFEDTIEHELVHAMDPKLKDPRIYYGDEEGRGGVEKKGAEPGDDDETYTKYIKSPWEFDAFTAPLINKISSNLDKTGDDRIKYRTLLIQLLSDLRTKDLDTVYRDEKYNVLAWLFTKKEWTEENWKSAWEEYSQELNKIKRWTTKPTLYKQFLKRLGTEI